MLLTILAAFLSAFPSFTNAWAPPSPGSLPNYFTPWEQIHQVLHLYPLAIDGKRADLFPQVFAADGTANYTGPPPFCCLSGLPAITQALMLSVSQVLSQHQLGTIEIDIINATMANTTTYFTATLFGTGNKTGSHVTLYGQYQDQLAQLSNGWRITERQLVFMGPSIGDTSLGG